MKKVSVVCDLLPEGTVMPMRTLVAVTVLSGLLGLADPCVVAAQNTTAEVQVLRARAEKGDPASQNNLGVAYFNGQGVPQDYAQAVAWYRKAAEQGHADAQFNLGAAYFNGQGVPQDFAQGVAWSRKAAEQGHADAQFNLGAAYFGGQGVPQDSAQAVAWYRKAAEQGFAAAQVNLGAAYFGGQSVPQDYAEAHKWYNLAASRTSGEEQERYARARDAVAKKMTPAQIADAQERARAWQDAFEKKKPAHSTHRDQSVHTIVITGTTAS